MAVRNGGAGEADAVQVLPRSLKSPSCLPCARSLALVTSAPLTPLLASKCPDYRRTSDHQCLIWVLTMLTSTDLRPARDRQSDRHCQRPWPSIRKSSTATAPRRQASCLDSPVHQCNTRMYPEYGDRTLSQVLAAPRVSCIQRYRLPLPEMWLLLALAHLQQVLRILIGTSTTDGTRLGNVETHLKSEDGLESVVPWRC